MKTKVCTVFVMKLPSSLARGPNAQPRRWQQSVRRPHCCGRRRRSGSAAFFLLVAWNMFLLCNPNAQQHSAGGAFFSSFCRVENNESGQLNRPDSAPIMIIIEAYTDSSVI